jgi:hypothetical protein
MNYRYMNVLALFKTITCNLLQSFQYLSSLPVLHYLQVVLFLLRFEQFS